MMVRPVHDDVVVAGLPLYIHALPMRHGPEFAFMSPSMFARHYRGLRPQGSYENNSNSYRHLGRL